VKEVNAEKLRCEFDDISFKSGECIEEFDLHISGLANQLRSLGDNVPDKKVVRKMLQSVLDNLEQVATETLLDLDSLLIEEVVGHLQAVENRRKKKTMSLAKDGGGQLLLTGEQWKAKYMASSGEKSASTAMAVAVAMGTAMAAGAGTVDLAHVKGRKTSVGPLRSVVFAVASRVILPVTTRPRRSRTKGRQTWPKRSCQPCYTWSGRRYVLICHRIRARKFQNHPLPIQTLF
jgi:hypothetical protein